MQILKKKLRKGRVVRRRHDVIKLEIMVWTGSQTVKNKPRDRKWAGQPKSVSAVVHA